MHTLCIRSQIYSALGSDRCIASIDKALSAGDFQALLAITNTDGFKGLFDEWCDSQTPRM